MTHSLATIVALGAAVAVVYFLGAYLFNKKRLNSMTMVERAQAVIEESRAEAARPGRLDFIRLYLLKQGFGYGLNVAFVAWTVCYVTGALVLTVLGMPIVAAVFLGFPIATAVIWGQLAKMATQRRRMFNRQLLDFMKLMANQLSAGSGPQRAIEQVIPSLPDPLRSELSAAMDEAIVSKDMVTALSELRDRYPSDAFNLFVTALQLNRDSNSGGRLEPTIRRAAEIMARNFELGDEAVAEISQVRSEFYAVLGVISLIGVILFRSGGTSAHAAYTSVVGLVVLGLAIGWAAFGSFLCIRMFNKARGDM